MRQPSRAPSSRYGAALMFSIPPATSTSASPARIACAASATVFSPEPQTLFTVVAGTVSGSPPRSAACRAGFWPRPADRTLPISTSSTASGSTPARRTASAMTRAPRSTAGTDDSAPWKPPMGVRTALTMTASLMDAVKPTPGSSSRSRRPTRRWGC